jgi:hypothetical protein
MPSSVIQNPVCNPQDTHYVSATESSLLILYKIWCSHGGDYEECRLLGYKIPVRTSQETHYVSATESSHLMLCKIWGFRGLDYEECRLLGYKIPVRTSHETHYVSATESSLLMLCKIWGFQDSRWLKNVVFWDATPCGSCKNGRFGGMCRIHHQVDKNWRTRNNVSNNIQPKHVAKDKNACFVR